MSAEAPTADSLIAPTPRSGVTIQRRRLAVKAADRLPSGCHQMPRRIWTADEATRSWQDAITYYEQSVTEDGFVSHRPLLEFARRIAAKAYSPDILTWIGMGVLNFAPRYHPGEPNCYGYALLVCRGSVSLLDNERRLAMLANDNVSMFPQFAGIGRTFLALLFALTVTITGPPVSVGGEQDDRTRQDRGSSLAQPRPPERFQGSGPDALDPGGAAARLTLDQAVDRLEQKNQALAAMWLEVLQTRTDILTAGQRPDCLLFIGGGKDGPLRLWALDLPLKLWSST
jgi:hypothetical protein